MSAAMALRAASNATSGIRALCASGSRATRESSSLIASILGLRSRTVARAATRWCAQPASASTCASAVRAKPPITSPARSMCARNTATSRGCGYGARGSSRLSSPSSQMTISPRSCTGANTALRVPSTTSAAPRRTANHRRYLAVGPSPAARVTHRSPSSGSHAADNRSRSR
ncbi:Uncharacterised protein [Mycobacteroides abscessus subsp. abscessus]|nr:Uncharacterised protein [Mycobacteroides abscessus subsp. abscessus]